MPTRATATLVILLALLAFACTPAEDEAGVPTPEGTPVEGDEDAMDAVRDAASATLAQGRAGVTIGLAGDEPGAELTLSGTDDFDADRRRLEPRGAEEALVVDGSEVFVRSAALTGATWARFDLDDVAGEGTAATEDLRLLPLTDSAGVLRTLADAGGAARVDGPRYVVRLTVDEERGLLGGGEYWIERYAQVGMDEVEVTVTIDGDRVREVAYTVPTPADRGLEQGEQVTGDDGDGLADAGLALTITYGAPAGDAAPERPADADVADVPAADVAELLPWSPTAGALPGTGDPD